MTGRRWLVAATLFVLPPVCLLSSWWAAGDARLAWLSRLLYLSMPLVLLFAAVAALLRWRARTTSAALLLRQHLPGLVWAIVLTAIVVAVVPAAMRQQFDETSLAGVAQNMHTQRAALITTAALPFDSGITPLENMVDKRPTLFAFLVSLLHDGRGFRVGHAFVVNAVLLGLGLWLLGGAVRARLGAIAGFAAPVLMLAVPLTAVVATSAGFELLAAVLLSLVLVLALDFVQRPDSRRWLLLLAVGVLLAHSRYESLLALFVTLSLALGMTWRRWRLSFGAWLGAACASGLLMPLAFLLQHARDPSFYPEALGQPLMSLQHLGHHLPSFFVAWFDPSSNNLLPGLVAIAGAIAVGVWLQQRRAGCNELLVVAPVIVVTGVVLLWFYGDVNEPTALRLFLPLAWLTALTPLLFVALWRRRAAFSVLVCASVLAASRLSSLHRGDSMPDFRMAAIVHTVEELVRRQASEPSTTLWVGTTAQSLIVHGHAAMSARAFERRAFDVQQVSARGDLRTIYVVETPLDAAMAQEFGEPRALLQRFPSDVVARFDTPHPITVHRLRR